MNKRQRIVQEAFLNNEEAVIRRLKQVYSQSLKDIEKKAKAFQDQINELDTLSRLAVDADEKEKILSMKQAKVYQKQYQDALKKQIGSILDNMQVEEFKTVAEYLNKCYEEGFLGTMYDLQGQGIPLIMPIDQESIVRAVQLDSKISEGLYSRLGEDVTLLKKKIVAQVSRGIATGMTFQQVAQQLAGYTNIGYNNAVRIVRTEGHRIQIQSAMDACYKAKDKGANIVKQWDSTLDGKTRPSHQKVDGEIRELDEAFSNGLMFPGDPNGGAKEVVNCRCALLQRAKWALDESELETLKERAAYYGLDKSDNFEDFKKKYLKATEESSRIKQKLTDIDIKAIHDYMSTKSYVVNEKLRTGAKLSDVEIQFVKDLDAVLDKMPIYEGNLQRSLLFRLNEDIDVFLRSHKIDNIVKYNEFISTTKGDIYNPDGQIQIYIQNAKNGRDISFINESENEVMYPRNATFKVINVIERDGKYYILMEEADAK